jgi:hypothetical protein
MESSLSTPHCSFVIYLHQDVDSLNLLAQDFRAFFQKFPLNYELICVTDPSANITENVFKNLQTSSPQNESWMFHKNAKHLGRAASLKIGADQARADFIIFPSLEMATPLGDLFKILQTLMTEPTLMMCWGERLSKKSALATHATPAKDLETLFGRILKDRQPHSPADMLCEVGGLRRQAWIEIKYSDVVQKKKGWYLGLSLQQAAVEKKLSHQTLFVHDSGKRTADFSLWKARFELLRQSIF